MLKEAMSRPGICPRPPKRRIKRVHRSLPRLTEEGGKNIVRIAACGINKSWRATYNEKYTLNTHLINTNVSTNPDIGAFLNQYPALEDDDSDDDDLEDDDSEDADSESDYPVQSRSQEARSDCEDGDESKSVGEGEGVDKGVGEGVGEGEDEGVDEADEGEGDLNAGEGEDVGVGQDRSGVVGEGYANERNGKYSSQKVSVVYLSYMWLDTDGILIDPALKSLDIGPTIQPSSSTRPRPKMKQGQYSNPKLGSKLTFL